jgi:23S rRNA (adenine2503-C2)-methyltransferase
MFLIRSSYPRMITMMTVPHLASSYAIVSSLLTSSQRRLATISSSSSFYYHPTSHRWLSSNSARFSLRHDDTTTTTIIPTKAVNLLTIQKEELDQLIVSWGYPKYRSDQIWKWVREQGILSVEEMTNIPKKLRLQLQNFPSTDNDDNDPTMNNNILHQDKPSFKISSNLKLELELISKDGTRKRVYQLQDGQRIESVLMPYQDGRYTACISSQAGCAMGCTFCATGQMGFARQLTSDEIFEQVARFDAELRRDEYYRNSNSHHTDVDVDDDDETTPATSVSSSSSRRGITNVVLMGMGEPLANYRNVRTAIQRMTQDLKLGARRITLSTVGVVPNLKKLQNDPDMPPIRLAVSLHAATDAERTKLLPANARYGGLDELMMTLKDYIETTNRRITLEWALIEYQNDDPHTARQLGNLITRFGIRRDMIHVNVIPLNPTGGFGGTPSGRTRVDTFCSVLMDEYRITCTPRVRRGIDIDAGCGQLKAKLQRLDSKEDNPIVSVPMMTSRTQSSSVGVYEDEDDDKNPSDNDMNNNYNKDSNLENIQSSATNSLKSSIVEFTVEPDAINMDMDDYEDPEFQSEWELSEVDRWINLVQQQATPVEATTTTTRIPTTTTTISELPNQKTTTITNEDAIREARKRRKQILKQLKIVTRLGTKKRNDPDYIWNEEETLILAQAKEWQAELESLEHNLQ